MRRPDFLLHTHGRAAGSPRKRQESSAGRLRADGVLASLGRNHPLVHKTNAPFCTGRQSTYVAAVLTGSIIARAEGGRWAAGLVFGAAGVLAVLSLLLALRAQARSDCVTDLIIEGNEDLPIRAVQRTRRRLVCARNRRSLARRSRNWPTKRLHTELGECAPLYEPRVVVQVVNELRELGAALQTGHVSARGVACAEHLVCHATSPLYGRDATALRQELRRVVRDGSE